jgi:PAS domain S-box-containing protein
MSALHASCRIPAFARACAQLLFHVLATVLLCAGGPACAQAALQEWREQTSELRILLENDLRAAPALALRLQEKVPAEATAADHVGLLNLLSRTEIYSARTEIAMRADRLCSQGRHAEALALFDRVAKTYERYPSKIGRWFALTTRSDTHYRLGALTAARADAELAVEMARDIGLARDIAQSTQLLAHIQVERGDHERAYHQATRAGEMAEQGEQEKTSARVVEAAKRYEAESKRRHIEELTQRNAQQTAELWQRLLWTVLGGSIAMLAGTVYFLQRLRRSNAIIRNLNASLEERVQAQTDELRQQTRYLRTLVDALPLGVWLKDTRHRYLAANQTATKNSGMLAEAVAGKTDLDIWPQQQARKFMSEDIEVMRMLQPRMIEEEVAGPNGAAWIETYKAPVLDEDGTVLGTVGFGRDISERKIAEAAREAALVEAQRLAQVRSDFLAQMSHELRTPLNGILGYAQILRADRKLDDQQHAALNVIQQSGEHLLTLINDILDSAKIEAGKLELMPSTVSLPHFLKGITEIIRIKADQKGLAFSLDAASDLQMAVNVDERRLRQVLLNLLANAVTFTEQGAVRLSVRREQNGRLRFEVEDTGVGMSPAQLIAVFQPFAQTGGIRHRQDGTGLGLAISRRIIRLMGGDIAVESALGRGSRFSFELALPAAVTADAAPRQADICGYQGQRRTVLVVDDAASNRAVAADMLRPLGFEILEASGGEHAIEAAGGREPDLVLMDVVMAGIDGVECVNRLRALPGLHVLPIIAISASASAEDRQRYLAAGMDVFLPKPVMRDALLHQIGALLRLTWITVARTPDEPHALPLTAPTGEEMQTLHRLARIGNMSDILTHASYLQDLDERYRPFAQHLATLAKTYQSQAILRFVESHMSHPI